MSRIFGWDYPPGVTGNEYEIAGADYEKEVEGKCPQCGESDCLAEQGYRYQRWVDCHNCDYHADLPDREEIC